MQLRKKNNQKIKIITKRRELTLPYYYSKNEEKILSKKLDCEKRHVTCNFKNGKIHDFLNKTKNSLEITRKWNIHDSGKIKLSFCIQSPKLPKDWIIPCVNYNGNPKGEGKFPKPSLEEGWSFREDRIGIPSCTIIKDDNGPFATFTMPAREEKEISSVMCEIDGSGVSLVTQVPFSEKPRRHTNKYYLGDLSGAKKKFFKINGDFEYARKFFILWNNNPKSGYQSLMKKIWEKLSPKIETHNDWGKQSELRINHLLNNLYVEKGDASGFISSIHWSMIPINNTISGGFVGKNPEIILSLYRAYLDCGKELLRKISKKVMNFFMDARLPNGLMLSDYQLAKNKWYGLHFLGKKECSTRMMGEMAYNFLRTYKITEKNNDSNQEWFKAAEEFCDFMVEKQQENGNFGKWWTRKGKLVDETGTNSAYVIWPLVELYNQKDNNVYLKAAEKAADYLVENFVEEDLYWGDALDSNCIDKEGGHSILKSLLLLHDVTENSYYLEKAEKVGNYVLTWMYFYDIPFSKDLPLGENEVKTTGGTSVSAAHHHLDPYGAAIAYDWLKLWRKTNDAVWKEYALSALDFVHQLLATREDPLDLPEYFEGWQPEQINQTEWDYLSNTIWGRGTYKNVIAWVPALTLGAFFDIREDFPNIMDFEIQNIRKYDSRELKLSKLLRKFGTWVNFLI